MWSEITLNWYGLCLVSSEKRVVSSELAEWNFNWQVRTYGACVLLQVNFQQWIENANQWAFRLRSQLIEGCKSMGFPLAFWGRTDRTSVPVNWIHSAWSLLSTLNSQLSTLNSQRSSFIRTSELQNKTPTLIINRSTFNVHRSFLHCVFAW